MIEQLEKLLMERTKGIEWKITLDRRAITKQGLGLVKLYYTYTATCQDIVITDKTSIYEIDEDLEDQAEYLIDRVLIKVADKLYRV